MAGVLHVEPLGLELFAQDGETVLQVFRREGYSMFVGCTRGGCGVCLVEVEGGVFHLGPHAEELVPDANHTLACRAVPEGRCRIRMESANRLQRSVMRLWVEKALRRGGESLQRDSLNSGM